MWLARLTEMGLLRASFVPPKAIRDLRDYTRMRTRLTQERTRCFQRLEKLLESALVKVSSVASKLTTLSAQDMIKAMIAGQRDPQVLASLARTSMKAKREELVEALDGMFDDHHGELAGLLLDQIAFLDERIKALSARAAGLAAAMPAAWGVNADGTTGPDAGDRPGRRGAARRGPAGGDPRHQPRPGPGHHRGNRPGHVPVPHRRPPGVLGRAVPLSPPVRPPHPGRQEGPGRHLAAQRPRPGRQRRRPHRRPSSASGTTGSPAAAARPRPRSPSPAPSWSSSGTCSPTPPPGSPTSAPATTRPAPTPTEDPQPHPADPSARLHRHHHQGRLTHTAPDQARSPPQARVRCRAPIYGR